MNTLAIPDKPAPAPSEVVCRPDVLDTLANACRARGTGGLSPAAGLLAWYDWALHLSLSPGKQRSLIEKGLHRFVKDGVTKKELSDSQANFIGRLPLSLESNGGVVSALLSIERYELGLDYYHRYADMVRNVTRGDVLETARKFIDPDRLVVSTAGP